MFHILCKTNWGVVCVFACYLKNHCNFLIKRYCIQTARLLMCIFVLYFHISYYYYWILQTHTHTHTHIRTHTCIYIQEYFVHTNSIDWNVKHQLLISFHRTAKVLIKNASWHNLVVIKYYWWGVGVLKTERKQNVDILQCNSHGLLYNYNRCQPHGALFSSEVLSWGSHETAWGNHKVCF